MMVLLFCRFDKSLVDLMNWYEAIFGKEIWKSIAFEVSFWGHSKEDQKDRAIVREVS